MDLLKSAVNIRSYELISDHFMAPPSLCYTQSSSNTIEQRKGEKGKEEIL